MTHQTTKRIKKNSIFTAHVVQRNIPVTMTIQQYSYISTEKLHIKIYLLLAFYCLFSSYNCKMGSALQVFTSFSSVGYFCTSYLVYSSSLIKRRCKLYVIQNSYCCETKPDSKELKNQDRALWYSIMIYL